MTVFIWDGSSYDGHISIDQFRRAMSEGVVAFTHRLTRQGGALDTYAAGNLSNARAAGISLLGAYAVTYTSGGSQQDNLTVQQADQQIPWWRAFPGWFWQEDLEKWSTDSVAAALGMQSARELRGDTGKVVVLYASHGQYFDQLRAWDGPLWNADYTSHAAGTVLAMYPGDNWRPGHPASNPTWHGGWTAYSGREPDLLQYTSSATIGGLTTCDASAFRGTYDQLRALLAPTATPSPQGDNMVMLKIILPDGSNRDGIADGMGGWRWMPTMPALNEATAAFGASRRVTADLAAVVYGIVFDAKGNYVPAAAPPALVAMTDADRQAIADIILAGLPKAATPADVTAALAKLQLTVAQ